jgi:NarL family two-component system response regulator LiaR
MAAAEAIRVLIVDDHAMVREGLKQFLTNIADLEYAGEASNGAEAVTLYQSLQPDVVLMDLFLPDKSSGIDAIRQILQLNPVAAVIALTSSHDVEMVKGALSAGATSYLLKNVSAVELAEAIRSTHQGRASLAQEATEALIQATRDTNAGSDHLTEREYAVLKLLVDGCSNAEIAERLHVTVATVKFHVGSILSKLGAANRAEAVSLALRRRLVSPEN